MLHRKGWGAKLLGSQKAAGYWERSEPGEPSYENIVRWVDFTYYPKFKSTNWIALVLSDLGMTKEDARIRKVADVMFRYKLRTGAPINIYNEGSDESSGL